MAEVAPEPGSVLVVAPTALLHSQIPQPDGQVLYDMLTGHPDRAPRELVFLADLTVELRAWPKQTWTTVGISPEVALLVVVHRWRAGHVKGLEHGWVSAEEARALARPAMAYAREQLRGRLAREITRRCLRWLHPTGRRRPGERFLWPVVARQQVARPRHRTNPVLLVARPTRAALRHAREAADSDYDRPGDPCRMRHSVRLADATGRWQQARDLVAALEHGPGRLLRRGDLVRAREQAKQVEQAYQVARQAADRAADRERHARQEQQQYQAHQEANPDLVERRRELLRVQAWRKRADARAVEVLRPEWSRELGARPTSVKAGRVWDRAVEQTIEYRQRWNVADAEHLLGREPHGLDASLEQRQAWRHTTHAVGRLRDLVGDRTERSDRQGATGRSEHRSNHEGAIGRRDHRGDQWRDRRRPLERERDHDHERAI